MVTVMTVMTRVDSDTDHNDDTDNSKNDDSVFEHDTASDVIKHSTVTRSRQNAETAQDNPNPIVPPLRLTDRPPHLNAWMTDGAFTLVDATTQKKKMQINNVYKLIQKED